MLKVCITGGPCGGKSSIQGVLTQLLAERGYKTLICPETPTELILNGIVPGPNISMEDFQKFVMDKQLAKEKLYDEAAKYYDPDKLVIIYDRGLCDQKAYVSEKFFNELLAERGLTPSMAYSRYDAVIHLVTAADGAVEFYQWNDPSKPDTGNNAARRESPEEAIEVDRKTLNSWIGHPHLRVFKNSTTFDGKIKGVVAEIFSLLGEPVPKEIERKFLIKKPSQEVLDKLGCVSLTNIIQTYLVRKNPNVERRVRQRGTNEEGYTFFYAEKTDTGLGERIEVERKISSEEYIKLLTEADTTLHQIQKVRRCFVYEGKYFEMDVYPFSDEYAIMEIELQDINEKVDLPPVEIVKEVTDDPNYRNGQLAKTMKL